MDEKVIIIGGGLSGLYLAYLLKKQQKPFVLLEGSERVGGRIQTIAGTNQTPLELGATWFSDVHPSLLALLEELHIEKYPQYSQGISLFETKSFEPPQQFFVPESQMPSYRVSGGTQEIINTLASSLAPEQVCLNAVVTDIIQQDGTVRVLTALQGNFTGTKAVVCLPPQLAVSTINFDPALPMEFMEIASSVQTWMAGALKFVLEYQSPFWKDNGFSGMLYSHAGIITEMYDHTNSEGTRFGFTGFLNPGTSAFTSEVRCEAVLQHLSKLLGPQASEPLSYHDKVWNDSFLIKGSPAIHRPHQNNGHPLLHKAYLDDMLLFSGTETDSDFPGYMEGALRAAKRTAALL